MSDERQEDTQPNPEPGAAAEHAGEPALDTVTAPKEETSEGEGIKTPAGVTIVNQDDEDMRDPQALQDMLGMYEESMRNLEEGEILKGRVLRVNENEVVVDIGFKSEGIIPLEEFSDGDMRPDAIAVAWCASEDLREVPIARYDTPGSRFRVNETTIFTLSAALTLNF